MQTPIIRLIRRAAKPYLRYMASKIGTISSSIWMEEANMFSIDNEEFIAVKFDVTYALKELLSTYSNLEANFDSNDIKGVRAISEAIHLANDIAITMGNLIDIHRVFERLVSMTVLMRSVQQELDPGPVLRDIAIAINENESSRRLAQCKTTTFVQDLNQIVIVANNSYEQGLLDSAWAIHNGIHEPIDVVRYIGCKGDAAC